MTVKYRSTGKEVSERAPAEKSAYLSRRQQRDEAMAQIYERREALEKAPATVHEEAVAAFDYAYKDVTGNPQLLREVVSERQRLIEEAAKKREVIDWHRALPEIGEKVRQKAGLPTSAERDRAEALDELREARGQK
jgi:hypothetical protein